MEHLIKKTTTAIAVIAGLVLLIIFFYYLAVMRAFHITYSKNDLKSQQYAYEYFVKEKSLEKNKLYEVVLLHQDFWNFNHLVNRFLSFFVTDLPFGNSIDSIFEVEVTGEDAVLKKIRINKLVSIISLKVDSKTFDISKQLNYSGQIIRNLEVDVYDPETGEKWRYRVRKIDLSRLY